MALRRIRVFEDPVLRRKAKRVEKIDENIRKIADDMVETLYENDGIGLAATQIGILKRICVIDVGDGDGLLKLINPKIVDFEGEEDISLEGCLSFPRLYGNVKRSKEVTVKALDINGKKLLFKAEGMLARCLQHELDHLDGKVFIDIASDLHEVDPAEIVTEEPAEK